MEKIYKDTIDLKTGKTIEFWNTVTSKQDDEHKKYSLIYEGYIGEWKERQKRKKEIII